MKYASETINLMAAFPGREFKMIELVRNATGARELTVRERSAARQGVLRVVKTLEEMGQVCCRPSRPGVRNVVTYFWGKCDMQ